LLPPSDHVPLAPTSQLLLPDRIGTFIGNNQHFRGPAKRSTNGAVDKFCSDVNVARPSDLLTLGIVSAVRRLTPRSRPPADKFLYSRFWAATSTAGLIVLPIPGGVTIIRRGTASRWNRIPH